MAGFGDGFKRWLANDIGIDLGTANSLVFLRGHGILLREPSVVAVEANTKRPLAVGKAAKVMIGRTPGNIIAVRPMKEGVIADFEVTETMLRYFIQKAHRRFAPMRPRVLVAVPSGITEVEQRAVEESARNAGAREVHTIPEPMAAAIGAGLPVNEPTGNMIVDIGGGTSEIAVISLGGMVEARSVRTGGDGMDEAVIKIVKRRYNLDIGQPTAEDIKITIGSAYPLEDELTREVKGRDVNTGLPKTIEITSVEVREALLEPISSIVDAIRVTLERCPPELAADLIDHGIVLAGGSAMLRGLDQLVQEETGLPVTVADNPLEAVALGTGQALETIEQMSRA